MNMKIKCEGYILVPDADLSKVAEELTNHIELTRREEGCLVFHVTQDAKNKNRFDVYEEFSNQEAFEIHQDRIKNSKWSDVSKHVKRNYKISTFS